ncbi:MAG: hypothetical protein JXR76_10495 [Deltaproteobacteria bacterium]|nr:hypothetical protein [Deltaproteobacteria bacterium]
MINTHNQPIPCVTCGLLALAKIEGIPFCARCLLARLDSLERLEIQECIEPLTISYASIEAALMNAMLV